MTNYVLYIWEVNPLSLEGLSDIVSVKTRMESTDWDFISDLYFDLTSLYPQYRIELSEVSEIHKRQFFHPSTFDKE